ncbi:MAG: hypothetical protein HY579_11420 [Nitrospinae bacterium]|nr:hypothetical protein [Nitrospinota bacterium]
MKKISFLAILVVLALAIDGTLTYEFSDLRIDPVVGVVLLVFLGLIAFLIIGAGDIKKDEDESNRG